MKIGNIISGAKTFFTRSGLKIKAHSPEILLVFGIGGVIAGTALACRATTKAHRIKEEMDISLKEIADCEADEGLAEQYTEEDARNDRINVYFNTGLKMAGAYVLATLVLGAGIGCIIFSNKIERGRASAAIAFGNAAMAALSETRARLAERNGKEAADEIVYGFTKVKRTDPELYSSADGSGGSVETEELCVENDGAEVGECSPYARFIDKKCAGVWDKSEDLTLMTIKCVEREMNDTLISRCKGGHPGYVILAEALQRLCIPRDRWPKDAAMVGWLYDKKDPKLHNYIDFGPLYSITKLGWGDEGFEKAVLVDFNVDGIVYNRL